ncbi:DUF1499 domain-containing protein [Rhodovulum sp. DZ06]|uniref:DUF1499 domain-containing protein n=1 Tax=Rhodovulum sp. DZ06 TaxID=3425126 RepID=UPI003D352CE3
MKLLLVIAALIALVALGLAVRVRTAPDRVADWHVDPVEGARTGKPNDVLVGPMAGADRPAPTWDASPEMLMHSFSMVAEGAENTTLLAGSEQALHATWIQRTPLMAFPDYISVRALPAEGGATLAIWSRSRYGHSDLGVNARRVADWIAAVDLPRVGE